jgi:hypothetical protein
MDNMKSVMYPLTILLVLGAALGCGDSPQVFQGTVVAYEASQQLLTVADENPPHQQLVFSLEKVEKASDPAGGEIVRISYRDVGGRLEAIRIMAVGEATH